MPPADEPPEIQEIIQQLQDLQVQAQVLQVEQGRLTARLRARVAAAARAAPGQPPRRQRRAQPVPAQPQFAPGDLVYITSPLGRTHVIGRAATAADRAGTVTRVNDDWVWLTTFNGKPCRRIPRNVRHLPADEAARIRLVAIQETL